MTTVYILRHGRTASNARRACLGLKDVPLDEEGMRQARILCCAIEQINIDAVYTSPLRRAVDTIAPYIEHSGKPLSMSYGLIERDFGIWDDMTFEEIRNEYPKEYKLWQNNWINYKIPGGESSAEAQNRVNMFLDRLLEEHDGETVILMTHLGTARHIISYLLGLAAEQSWLFTLDNCSAAIVEVEKDRKGILKGLNIQEDLKRWHR